VEREGLTNMFLYLLFLKKLSDIQFLTFGMDYPVVFEHLFVLTLAVIQGYIPFDLLPFLLGNEPAVASMTTNYPFCSFFDFSG
jgi:hypothetical protein